MQQRRLRLGDILDDYCPRERRITNHAIVAMIDDEVKQTRCTTCDADHEYKQAKVPPQRKKKEGAALQAELPAGTPRKRQTPAPEAFDEAPVGEQVATAAIESESETDNVTTDADIAPAAVETPAEEPELATGAAPPAAEDEGPVHRPLIRATLPRPEGQTPERKIPEFTVRQPGSRAQRGFGQGGGGNRSNFGRRPVRTQQGQPAGPTRFGGSQRKNTGRPAPRTGSGQGNQGQRAQQQRPGRHAGQGRGRKRGR